jgi:predicted membrane protein
MSQSRKHSLLEALLNTSTGFLTSLLTQKVVFPMFGFYPAFSQNLIITLIFTIVSIVRSYVWRRVFNALEQRGILK